ncbi:hypothetical protein Golax_009379 [Gossypium laxum]|uniref:A20-type domain-containing protein n=1 Tax=Gossypium laxum TaxID=34288 RepID=A0A7J9ACS9_9ROSI|nr:hypothetical protein [Gossypium laxum]
MAEEHRCQAPEGHRLCVNNCGFFGSSATMNLCSKCYRDLYLKEQEASSIKSALSSSPSSSSTVVESISQVPLLALLEVNRESTCGVTFCGSHRYPENHGCTFDFKKVGREEIARANPLVKAEKLEKI